MKSINLHTVHQDVNFRYSEKTPLLFQDVDFNLSTESRIGLVGPNGVGKSTLLNVIYGYSKPSRGIVKQNPRLRIGVFPNIIPNH